MEIVIYSEQTMVLNLYLPAYLTTKVNVKILQGAECNVDVTHGDSVETLKELVKAQLNISPGDQKLPSFYCLIHFYKRAQALHLVEEMKVNVKILQGAECNVDVTHGDSVETLKELVKAQLNISPSDQKLMLRGKKLQEGTLLGDYNLREGDRLHLVVKKEATPDLQGPAREGPAPATGCIETQTEPSRREVLESTIARILRPHYTAEADAKKVAAATVKNFDKKLNCLSLEDIEKICESWGRDQRLHFL